MHSIPPPQSEQELLERTDKLLGQPLGHLMVHGKNFHKGAIGQWLEQALGTNAGNTAQPDFVELQTELKTLPIGKNGRPQESTFVTAISLTHIISETWETSRVYHKLKRVLWIPIEADSTIPIAERRIGQAFLWSPNSEQMAILKNDWEEFSTRIAIGQLETISAKDGILLQIRPKAANGQSLSIGHDESGKTIRTLPRGFYLRASFTDNILKEVNNYVGSY